jgi:hypothetical protein
MSKRGFLIAGLAAVAAGSIAVAVAGGAGSQVPGKNGVLSSDIAPRNVRASDVAKPTWQPLKPINGWAAFGEGTRPTKVAKDSFGFIHLRGALKRISGTSDSPFKLAKGFRPRVVIYLPIAINLNTTAQLKIDTNGLATIQSQGGTPGTFSSVEGVEFIP